MTATIYRFEDHFMRYIPQVPSVAQLVITLKLDHWKELNNNQKQTVFRAEIDVMNGDERPKQLEYLHKLLLKLTSKELP